jgi:signal transduction histidine kinase
MQRQRSAYFFVTAFSLTILGAVIFILRGLGLLPSNALTFNGIQIGSALEMLLLAFALADRFIQIRRKATDDVRLANVNLEQRLQAREAELAASHERLRKIEQQETVAKERQRMMQDMHDGLGSSLRTALLSVEKGHPADGAVAEVLQGCIDDLKLAIDSMEPVQADLLLLLATWRFRLDPRLDDTGISLLWEVTDVPALDWLDPKSALHILRILQEALTNIIKHTHATKIRVATRVDGDQVLVSITDNGQGFAVASALKQGGKGLSNQMRRAQSIGAEVNWDSNDAGTCFTLRLPIRRGSTARA